MCWYICLSFSGLPFFAGLSFWSCSDTENTAPHASYLPVSVWSVISAGCVWQNVIWGGIFNMSSTGRSRKWLLNKFLLYCLGLKWFKKEKVNEKNICNYLSILYGAVIIPMIFQLFWRWLLIVSPILPNSCIGINSVNRSFSRCSSYSLTNCKETGLCSV